MNDKDFQIGLDEKPFVCKAFSMFPLPDGIYNVLVIEARDGPDGDGVRVELALTDGPRKGEVVQLRATKLDRDPVLMLGLPGRLVVREGTPSFTLD